MLAAQYKWASKSNLAILTCLDCCTLPWGDSVDQRCPRMVQSNARCSAHEDFLSRVADLSAQVKTIPDGLALLRKTVNESNVSLLSTIREGLRDNKNAIESYAQEARVFQRATEERLRQIESRQAVADTNIGSIATLIEKNTGRIGALETGHSEVSGENKVLRSAKDRLPKWVSATFQLISIAIALALAIHILFGGR